ncbi:MAG TPA: MBL fold metallo-hydrolase [Polyangiaceae bacterium]|nr:MBL fold metallo-hydrolase [Polyangiaceae bacterium]
MSQSSSMTLQVLGSGAAFSRRYGTTCSVLTLPSGDRWLIDCGRQAPEQLTGAGLGWHDITGQLVTHVHGDHVFGLEEFAFVRYYTSAAGLAAVMKGGPRPRLVAHSAVLSELWEVLGPSLRYRSDAAGEPVTGSLADYFEVLRPSSVEAPALAGWNHAETFSVEGLSLVVRETRHVFGKPSTSIEFALPGQRSRLAWWSGDSVVDAELLQRLAPRTSVFFHDCTFVEFPGQVHGLFSDFERLDPSLREKIVLMHHDDGIEQHRERAAALGFRLAMPGDVFDLTTGRRVQQG